MNKKPIPTGCLGVNAVKDLQPVPTPEGKEYIVKVGIFGTKSVDGRFIAGLSPEIVNEFNKGNSPTRWVCVDVNPTPALDPKKICAELTDLKTIPFGGKQIVTARMKPFGIKSDILHRMLEQPDGTVNFGIRGSGHYVPKDGVQEFHFTEIAGFNLVA